MHHASQDQVDILTVSKANRSGHFFFSPVLSDSLSWVRVVPKSRRTVALAMAEVAQASRFQSLLLQLERQHAKEAGTSMVPQLKHL